MPLFGRKKGKAKKGPAPAKKNIEHSFHSAFNRKIGIRELKSAERKELESLVVDEEGRFSDGGISFLGIVRRGKLPEAKFEKEKRIKRGIAVGRFRIFFIKRNRFGRQTYSISRNFHLFELAQMEQTSPTQVNLSFVLSKQKVLLGFTVENSRVPELVVAIRLAYIRLTCGWVSEHAYKLIDSPHLLPLPQDAVHDAVGPCHGAIDTYIAYCNLMNEEPSRELVQYMLDQDTHDSRAFDFDMVAGFEPKSTIHFRMTAVRRALQHNTYFTTLRLRDVNRKEAVKEAFQLFRTNTAISKLRMNYMPMPDASTMTVLQNALINNERSALQIVDFSHTPLKDRNAEALSIALGSLSRSLHTLILHDCSLGPKGVRSLLIGLSMNFGMSLGLEHLDLSYNKFDFECSRLMESWLKMMSSDSHLRRLRLSHVPGVEMPLIARPLHAFKNLSLLDISKNRVGGSAGQMLISCLKTATYLADLRLSECGLSSREAHLLLSNLSSNESVSEARIDLSGNNLNDTAAEALSHVISESVNLVHLDLGSNRFTERGIIGILQGLNLAKVRKIRSLVLGNALTSPKKQSAMAHDIASALSSTINSEGSTLQTLNIAGGFRFVVCHLLAMLTEHSRLRELDIGGNGFGDEGALYLSEILRWNETLHVVKCDDNGITLTGWQALFSCFTYNKTVRVMPYPWKDEERAIKALGRTPQGLRKREKLQHILLGIQRAVEANGALQRGDGMQVESFLLQLQDDHLTQSTDPLPRVKPMVPIPERCAKHSEAIARTETELTITPVMRVRGPTSDPTIHREDAAPPGDARPAPHNPDRGANQVTGHAAKMVKKGLHMEGWLIKQGGYRRNWKARYFVLNDGTLTYYNDPGDPKPLRAFDIRGATVQVCKDESISKPFCFEIHTTARTFYAHAENREEMHAWMSVLQKASLASDGSRETLQVQSTIHSPASRQAYEGYDLGGASVRAGGAATHPTSPRNRTTSPSPSPPTSPTSASLDAAAGAAPPLAKTIEHQDTPVPQLAVYERLVGESEPPPRPKTAAPKTDAPPHTTPDVEHQVDGSPLPTSVNQVRVGEDEDSSSEEPPLPPRDEEEDSLEEGELREESPREPSAPIRRGVIHAAKTTEEPKEPQIPSKPPMRPHIAAPESVAAPNAIAEPSTPAPKAPPSQVVVESVPPAPIDNAPHPPTPSPPVESPGVVVVASAPSAPPAPAAPAAPPAPLAPPAPGTKKHLARNYMPQGGRTTLRLKDAKKNLKKTEVDQRKAKKSGAPTLFDRMGEAINARRAQMNIDDDQYAEDDDSSDWSDDEW